MIFNSSNLIFPSLNRLILRLTERLYVNLMRIIYRLGICPPLRLFKHSFANVKDSASLNKDFVSGSCPVFYSSFRKSPASEANGVCIFEAMKIPELSHDDETKHYTDAFGAGNDLESVFEVFVLFDNQSDFSEDSVSLSFNGLNSFTVLPEHLCFNSLEFMPMSSQPSMHGSSIDGLGSSGVYLVHLPSHDRFDLCGFFSDSMPLPAEHSQMAVFYRRDIGLWNEFVFHDLGYLCGRDFVSVSHSRPQFTEIESVEQMDFIGHGLEHIPEPVIGSHRFDTDADRFFERLDKSEGFSGAMVWNSNFFDGVGCGIHSSIGSCSGMKIDS